MVFQRAKYRKILNGPNNVRFGERAQSCMVFERSQNKMVVQRIKHRMVFQRAKDRMVLNGPTII